MYNVQQMQQGQSQLPSWTAAMDPLDRFWHKDSSNVGSAQCQAPPVASITALNFTGSAVDHASSCNWTGSSDTARCIPSATPSHRMWDPIPDAPQGLRSQVLDLFSVTTTPADTEPVQDVSRSAPGCSELTSTEDLDSGKQPDASALSRTRSHPNTAEQKQANARESQKRFRMRQKARSQAIEAQLAGTVAELCKLRVQHQQLESRNLLLEKKSRLNHKQNEDQLTADGSYEKLYLAHETDVSENGPSVTISVRGRHHSMTVQEISVMPVSEFALLWTEYIREIGAALIQMEQTQDKTAQALMEKLTVESSRLLGCVKLLNHDVHKAMLAGKLDSSLASTHSLGIAFYTNLTVCNPLEGRCATLQLASGLLDIDSHHQSCKRLLAFSEEQLRDMMHLRRIYVTRRGLHAMERRELLSQAPVSHHQMPLPSDNLTQLSDLASQLKKNAADDYRVYHRIACAARRGVFTTKQWAILMVQSYPYLAVMETHLEVVAAERGEASRADLLASAQTNTLAAEWCHLNNYLELIASRSSHDYIPLAVTAQVQPAQSIHPSTASMSFAAEAALGFNLQFT